MWGLPIKRTIVCYDERIDLDRSVTLFTNHEPFFVLLLICRCIGIPGSQTKGFLPDDGDGRV